MEKQILDLVKQYIDKKEASKTWEAGKDWVQYAGPSFDSEEYVKAIESLLKGWLVMGPSATSFEKKLPPFFGKAYGVLTNSGSSSNLVMMSAMTSKRLYAFPQKTKVIVPVAGFPTTLNPILQVGFEPVFVDIEINTLNLDLSQVEEAARTSGAKIITFAHVLGNPPNMKELMKIVKQYDLILLEDCCDALGSTYNDKPLGSFGEMASCSFFPAHHITTGEGGFVATKTLDQEKVARSFREWGRGCYCVGKKASLSPKGTCGVRFNNWLPSLPDEILDHKYVYEEIGYNIKPTELQGAMGLAQIKKLDDIKIKRKENFRKIFSIFKEYEEFFILPRATQNSDPSWFAFPLTVKKSAPFKRKDIMLYMERHKIQTRTYFAGNILLQPAYSHLSSATEAMQKFPVATQATTDTFFLGTSPVITQDQIDYIKTIMEKFYHSI